MREIKFRIWCKQNESMQRVSKIGFDEGKLWYVLDEDHETQPPYFEDDDDWVLMQYTGLKDKNGKEIYEGDILRYLDSYDCSTESGYDFEEFLNVGQVIFNDDKGRFDITNKSDISYDDWIESVSDCEIIGNIYENPELLEGIA